MRQAAKAIVMGAATLLAGCAGLALSGVPAKIGNPPVEDLRLGQVQADPQAHIGAAVRWGGTIAGVATTKHGAKVEIEERVLDGSGAPQPSAPSAGRFVILAAGGTSPRAYALGNQVTVAGTVGGTVAGVTGEQPAALPVVKVEEYFVWGADATLAYDEPRHLGYYPYYGYPYRDPYGYRYWPYSPYGYGHRYGYGHHFGFGFGLHH